MNKVKVIFKYVGISLLCAFTLVCLYFVFCSKVLKQKYPTLFGMSTAIVETGSMHPTIKQDDLIITAKHSNYKVGDVITFKDGHNTTTHRIVAISKDGYITQGDANNTPDFYPVPQKNVYGKVIAHSSFLGAIVRFLQTPMGLLTIVFLLAASVSVVVLVDKIKQKAKNPPTDKSYTEL